MNKYGLKREILIDILDKQNINDNSILLLLKTEFEIHDFYEDKRFMPELKPNIDRQWRQDFLKEEAKEHIKEGDVDFAYKNLFELIRAENPGLHGANIHKMNFNDESDKDRHEEYYKDGYICEKEKNIIMEIINAIEEKENNNVAPLENQNLNNITKSNQIIKEKTKHLIKGVLFSIIFGSVGFMLLIEFLKTKNILYIIISIMMLLVTLLLLSPFYERFIFKKKNKVYNDELNFRYESDKKYNDVSIVINFNTKESKEHLIEDYKVLEKEGIENLIKNQFMSWIKGEKFKDRDDNRIYEGLKLYAISYKYGKIIDKYSPTGEENYFGQFQFSFESSNKYTKDMLESVTMQVYIFNGKIVKVSGFDD